MGDSYRTRLSELLEPWIMWEKREGNMARRREEDRAKTTGCNGSHLFIPFITGSLPLKYCERSVPLYNNIIKIFRKKTI